MVAKHERERRAPAIPPLLTPIWEALERQERSKAWLARKLHLDASSLYLYSTGQRHPRPETIRRACELLDIPVIEVPPQRRGGRPRTRSRRASTAASARDSPRPPPLTSPFPPRQLPLFTDRPA